MVYHILRPLPDGYQYFNGTKDYTASTLVTMRLKTREAWKLLEA